jgi:hypothetical protein
MINAKLLTLNVVYVLVAVQLLHIQVTSGSGGGVYSGNAASFYSCNFTGNSASTNVSALLCLYS